jgi:hypothetical protein
MRKLIARIHLFFETPAGEIKTIVQSVDAKSEKEYCFLWDKIWLYLRAMETGYSNSSNSKV